MQLLLVSTYCTNCTEDEGRGRHARGHFLRKMAHAPMQQCSMCVRNLKGGPTHLHCHLRGHKEEQCQKMHFLPRCMPDNEFVRLCMKPCSTEEAMSMKGRTHQAQITTASYIKPAGEQAEKQGWDAGKEGERVSDKTSKTT